MKNPDWITTMRRMMTTGCSRRECRCKAGEEQNCIWWDEPGDRPEPTNDSEREELIKALRRLSAEKTLEFMGYEWKGGEFWRPPLGKPKGVNGNG